MKQIIKDLLIGVLIVFPFFLALEYVAFNGLMAELG